MAYRIMVVDDEPEIVEIIKVLLEGEGYEVDGCTSAAKALEKMNGKTDLFILDVKMPDMNGYELCQKVRERSRAPIMFLTARGMENDKLIGFSCGADDYLVKPFSYAELRMRVMALLRRVYTYSDAKEKQDGPVRFRDLTIDEKMRDVRKNGKKIELTDREYEILRFLIAHKNQVLALSQIYEGVWNEEAYYGVQNTVMVHVRNLRKKIEEDPKDPQIIKTLWGRGYYCEE